MKNYPSVPRAIGTAFREIPGAHVFDKLDGSSMRSEWSRKRGWYKHGRRQGLLDDSNPQLAEVPLLFDQTLAEPLARVAHDSHWETLVVFYEFWGDHSLAGLHEPSDPKRLTLFDVAPDGAMMAPSVFRFTFEGVVPTARCIGQVNWTRGFVERVYKGEVGGITFEGVVAKATRRRGDILRAKAKTQKWIDAVIQRHGAEAGRRLVES